MEPAHIQFLRSIAAYAATILLVAGSVTAQPGKHDERTAKEIERVIFRAFPEADAFSSIQRDITQPHRIAVEKLLPFKVHFNELGTHRLFVAFRGRRPVGLVYLRTEEADWGLTEIAWHLSLDQRIVGFKFLRSRNRHTKNLERSPLAKKLAGRRFDEVAGLISEHGKEGHKDREASLVSMERTLLRSAAKSLAVLEVAWGSQATGLHDKAIGFDLFPAASQFKRCSEAMPVVTRTSKQVFDTRVMFAFDASGTFLGCVAWTDLKASKPTLALRWTISRELMVIAAQPTHQHASRVLRKACSELQGRKLSAPNRRAEHLAPLAQTLAQLIIRKGGRRISR